MTDFIHTPYQKGETIAAVATPPGEGGVAIIRISGEKALAVGDQIFSGPVKSYQSHTAHFGQVIDQRGEKVDDALVLVMLGKRSYTGEDTVEIHCHGGSLITRKVLEVALAAGARAARPGEFTFKAFMNGKIDLAQAEAVQELIGAKNQYALDQAEHQLEGTLSKKILGFQKELTDVAAILEAWVDFPEEGLEFASMDEVISLLERVAEKIEMLITSFRDGKIVHSGLSLCLVGSPNVGKSSIMNALLRKERAIVSSAPGTTRDILEDHLQLGGLNLRLSDTAGIRDSSEAIEREGIRRSKKAMEEADLILFVLDLQKGVEKEEKALIEMLPKEKTLALWNKQDLPYTAIPTLPFPHFLTISAKTEKGLDSLQQKINEMIWQNTPPSKEEILITNVRHKEALENAFSACQRVIEGLQTQLSPEFLTLDMRETLQNLGKIIGTNITEEILSAIFSKFCIGK